MFIPSITKTEWLHCTMIDFAKYQNKIIQIDVPFYSLSKSATHCLQKWAHVPITHNLQPYASVLQFVSEIESIFKLYMDNDSAVFAHPQQTHWNGNLLNDKPILKDKPKIHKIRDTFWNWRHSVACFNVQFLSSYFQCGGLALEVIHANFRRWFYPWMKHDGQGLYKAAAWQYLLTLKSNLSKIDTILKDCIDDNKITHWNQDWIDELYLHYDQTMSLLHWRKQNLPKHINNGHAYSYFKNIQPMDWKKHIGGIVHL